MSALLIALSGLPTIGTKIICRGCQDIRHGPNQVTTSVAIIVDAEFDLVFRHELGLTNFAVGSTAHGFA